jgi:hypothetical protein
LRAILHHRERQAGIDPLAIQEHGAGAALSVIAAFLGSCETKMLAQ